VRWWPWARQEPGWQAALRAAWAEAHLQAEAREAEQTAVAAALDDAEYQVHLAEMAGARAWLAEHPEPELEYSGEVAGYSQNYLTGGEPRSRTEERWFDRFGADVRYDAGREAATDAARETDWERGPDAARYDPTAQQARQGFFDRLAGALQGARDRLTGTEYQPMQDGEYRVLHPGGREYETNRRYEDGLPARNAYERGVYAEMDEAQAADEREATDYYAELADRELWERAHPGAAEAQRQAELYPEAWQAHSMGDHYFCADAGIDDDANPDPRDIAPGDEIEEGRQLEAWEYGPDAARYEPGLVQADDEADRDASPAGNPVLTELAEMDAAAIDTAIAEEEERAERSWERWMDEMAEEDEDPEARYVAGRDPRSEAEAQQFAEWDATAQAEADNGGWAGAGFTRPGPAELREEAMTAPHGTGCACQDCPDYDGPVRAPQQDAEPDMTDEQRARAAEYSDQYGRGRGDAQQGQHAAPDLGTEQEQNGYAAGHRWGQDHPVPYVGVSRGNHQQDQVQDRQMEA